MSSFFSSDGSSTIQFAIIFLVIFVVLAAVVFAFRRLTGRGHALSSKLGARGRQPRLGIVDIYELDRQRQLILLRRDNVEHLLLVGGPNDVVIERNISRGVGARLGTDEVARPEPEAEPAAALDPPRYPPAFEPAFEMPVVVAPPLPGSTTRPASVGRPLDLSDPDADVFAPEPARVPEPPVFAPAPRPAAEAPASRPARRIPPSLANLVPGAAKRARAAEDASAAEAQPELPAESRAPVAAPPTMPEFLAPASSAPASLAPASLAPASSASASSAPTSFTPTSLASTSQRAFDPAILSDMARQLEQAVRRPSSAVMPARPAQAEPSPEPLREPAAPTFVVAPVAVPAPVSMEESLPQPEVSFTTAPAPAEAASAAPAFAASRPAETQPAEIQVIDPMAAAMAATAEPPESPERDGLQSDDLFEAPVPSDASVTAPDRHTPEMDRSISAMDRSTPSPDGTVPAPVAPEPPPAAEPEPAPVPKPAPTAPAPVQTKPASAPNPFSVEEIEAEFARLLGRPLDRKG